MIHFYDHRVKTFLPYGPRNVSQKCQISAMIRKYRSDQAEKFVFMILRADRSVVTLNPCISATNQAFEI